MKKLLFMAFMGSFLFSSAQAQPGKIKDTTPRHPSSTTHQKPSKQSLNKDYHEGWYDITPSIIGSAPNSAAFTAYVGFIMPDSNGVIVSDDGSKYNVSNHQTGFVFDPKDVNLLNSTLNPPAVQLSRIPYILDSLQFNYLYVRNVDSIGGEKVIDTLIVQLYKMPALAKSNFGTGSDAQVYAKPSYVPATNKGAGATQEITILLTGGPSVYVQGSQSDSTTTDDETSWRSKSMVVPCSLSVPALNALDNIAGYTVAFRPMLRPNLGDTIVCGLTTKPVNRYNYFGYRYIVNTGDAGNQVDQKQFYNNSLVLTKFTRYGQTLNGWNGYLPGNAYFEAPYTDFYYHLNTNHLSTKDINKDGYGIGEAYPNPTNGEMVTIDFKLPKAEVVTMSLYDVTGKKVRDIASGLYIAGNNQASFNVDGLNSGVYFYTISAGNFVATKKITVSK